MAELDLTLNIDPYDLGQALMTGLHRNVQVDFICQLLETMDSETVRRAIERHLEGTGEHLEWDVS